MDNDRKYLIAIITVLSIVILPLLFNLPIWVALWCIAFWGYTLLASHRDWPWPNRNIRFGLTTIGFIMVITLLGGRTLSGSTFIGLLTIMAALKPLEIKSHRDRIVTLFLAYFIIISSLFVIENLMITLYMFFSVLVTTACLIHFNYPERKPKASLRLAGIIMMQAIPLMLLLFIFFPRIEGTFFTLKSRTQGKTGFSETLRPGSISRLVQEDKTAFRVEFQGEIPDVEELYWRGMVLWDFDGGVWRHGGVTTRLRKRIQGERNFVYDITLEPHRKKHLFALDLPVSSPAFILLTEDYTLMSRWSLTKSYRYQVRSFADARIGSLGNREDQSRRLPQDDNNLKSRALAQAWRSRSSTPEAIVDEALHYFSRNDFLYTLKPPLLDEKPIDTFLFESRKGYCEHYASAFAYLMRAAGLPARIVVGYLGGELNPYGNYLIVKQYHAHAWAEVFMEDRGWMRVDPTAVVAPERISMGLAESLLSDDLPDFLAHTGTGNMAAYWQKVRFMWDTVNLNWNAWFMEYSHFEQIGIWARLWKKIKQGKMYLLIGLGLLLFFMTAILIFRNRVFFASRERDTVWSAYLLFCRKLERAGIPRPPSLGPIDFSRMVGNLRTDIRSVVEEITRQYIALRYMRGGDETSPRAFVGQVKRFNPRASR